MTEFYDSRNDTLAHIRRVQELLYYACQELIDRGCRHDRSKLESPEKEVFDAATVKLTQVAYGSDEYQESLQALRPALEHHYAHNSHHPEHYEDGIRGMDVFDLLEMLLDWKAASERHANGDIVKSLQINRERFTVSQELYDILHNTVQRYSWLQE